MLKRIIVLDCLGILLVLCSAMVVGNLVSKAVGALVIRVLKPSSQQWAEPAAIVISLLAALAAGFGVGWLVRSM
jgi:hypothetical protein